MIDFAQGEAGGTAGSFGNVELIGVQMPLQTLLVHGSCDSLLSCRVEFASELARAHNAKVLVLFPLLGAGDPVLHAEHAPASAVTRRIKAERLRAESICKRTTRQMAVQGVRSDWIVAEGPAHDVLAARSAMADLLIMSWSEADWVSPQASSVVVAAGRPIMVVPPAASFAPCARRILVAWNGGRESARAIHDALPFLEKSEKVILFAAGDSEHVPDVSDAAAYLSAHHINAHVDRRPLRGPDAGKAILSAAKCNKADMIVMGAYGHSRLHEWTFGGATRTVLRSMTVPTLLSH
jgi:nucleotide-binding universal stress UspA family protein